MAKLSLYRPEKGNDFRFLDRVINEQFQVGGTDVLIHKYLGPVDPTAENQSPSTPVNTSAIPELGIQDVIFMENRDRHYAPDVYTIRGIYTLQDFDFNMSQFGMFLQNDTIMVMFHLRGIVDTLSRKLMSGDVIELPHQKDEYALDDSLVALKRFYVVQDVTRPASGYSQTWYPHLLRAKCVPLVDSQEFKEILDSDAGAGDGSTLRDLMSTYKQSIDINNQIIAQAVADAPLSGYNTKQFYVIPTTDSGLVDTLNVSSSEVNASSSQSTNNASFVLASPDKNMYVGYLTGDGVPPNGVPYGFGITFPTNPALGEFYLRSDYMPNRLFRYDGRHWIRFEDNVRMTLNNFGASDVDIGAHEGAAIQQTQKTSFINNTNSAVIAGEVVLEKQSLSKVLRPKADN